MPNDTALRLPRSRPRPLAVIVAALALSSAALWGCDDLKVKKPASDSTPPSLVWNVFNRDTNEQADDPGNDTIKVKRGASFRITLKAKDPEGVQSIELNPPPPAPINGVAVWLCVSSAGGRFENHSLDPLKQDLAPDADGMVLTSIPLFQNLDLSMGCKPGETFHDGSVRVTGSARNYSGLQATSVITFAVAP